MKTPEEKFYDLIKYHQMNGGINSIGRILNDISYEDGVHIMKRLANRFGYEVKKIVTTE